MISSASILILSGFVIGLAVGKYVVAELSPYVLSAGLAGVVAFLVCDRVATRRRELQLLEERRQLVGRLARHVMHSQGGASTMPHAESSADVVPANSTTPSAVAVH